MVEISRLRKAVIGCNVLFYDNAVAPPILLQAYFTLKHFILVLLQASCKVVLR